MLPRSYRLRSEREIKQAFRTRFQAKTPLVRVYFSYTKNPNFRLLVIVSKKIYKKANKRQRLKRRIQGLFENLLRQHRLPPKTACVIQVQSKELLHKKPADLEAEIVPLVGELFRKSAFGKANSGWKTSSKA